MGAPTKHSFCPVRLATHAHTHTLPYPELKRNQPEWSLQGPSSQAQTELGGCGAARVTQGRAVVSRPQAGGQRGEEAGAARGWRAWRTWRTVPWGKPWP